MPSISPKLQKIIDDFATKDLGGTASVEAVNLNDAINSSPILVERMNLAVSQGYLRASLKIAQTFQQSRKMHTSEHNHGHPPCN